MIVVDSGIQTHLCTPLNNSHNGFSVVLLEEDLIRFERPSKCRTLFTCERLADEKVCNTLAQLVVLSSRVLVCLSRRQSLCDKPSEFLSPCFRRG